VRQTIGFENISGVNGPDKLCSTCLAAFRGALTEEGYTPGVIEVDSRNPSGCKLCAVFISRFYESDLDLDFFKVEYVAAKNGLEETTHRCYTLTEILFRHAGSPSWDTFTVRFGVHRMDTIGISTQDCDSISLDCPDVRFPNWLYYETSLSDSTDSEHSMELAAKWFKDCMEKHEECSSVFPKSEFLPTRLVEISSCNDNNLLVRLRRRKSMSSALCYAALSHSWGSTMPFKLTQGNLASCMKSIPLNEISKVFQDAIRVASYLGIRYIWIDSLCKINSSSKRLAIF
jgi:hypothetical protein